MALNIAFDVIYSDVHDALARGLRRPGYVGRDDRVLCSLERVVRPDRLSGNDIEACRKHFSAVQGVGQVLLDDQLAAAVVDQDDAVFHFGDVVLIDDSFGGREERAVQENDVGPGKKLVQRHIFGDLTACFRFDRVIGQNLHVHGIQDLRRCLTDAAKTDDAGGLTIELNPRRRP